ncbi:MAG: PilT/PilU family type 4a pilus ATPase [Methylococcaceae bacterium]|nr:PilT/PilU family type 4a pilus ATPase [Methylococcaceae bacterium]MCI0733819.1 PilT/PilU family type 4a pilus ATPase [Methylococcaceae bacterium]
MDFRSLLEMMVQKKASDLFITVHRPATIKVHGRLQEVSKTPLTVDQVKQIVFAVMTQQQRDEFENTKECNFAISASGLSRFRVSAFVQRDMPGMVLRRIEGNIPTAKDLFLPSIINDLAMTKRGLIVFVGATGTGKSTSLAAMIKYRSENASGHIITIEDPLEYLHNHSMSIITQREVGIDTESYAVALKNTLRQAPDVILIGEVRTRETMQHAITFAETGHLCLTTLHANNANQALDRILHFFPEDMHDQLFMDLSLNLKGIIAQQLIRRADGKGRYPAVEVLLNTPLASDLIRKGEVHKLKELMKNSREQGMQTFDQALYDLYTEGKITYEDALNSADSMNEVRLMIKLGGEGGIEKYAREQEGIMLVDQEN